MGSPILFGVRHLSPASAYRLRQALDEARPQLVLVEGPSDLNDQMHWFCHPKTVFPAAILAYTSTPPVRTILYPFAEYSPEIQAILWAHEHGVPCRFMDLPSGAFLAFQAAAEERVGADTIRPHDDQETSSERTDDIRPYEETPNTTEAVYRRLEEHTGEDHDAFWERRFEQLADAPGFQNACNTFGRELRASVEDAPLRTAETLVREAYMKRVIREAVDGGVPPEKLFCVCGAFHVPGLEENEPMTDEELAALPCEKASATLMPYSYYRLSSRSGYGAGNKAPSYFHLLWKALNGKGVQETPYLYLTRLAAAHRKAGNLVSSAEVIEAVRLADTLAAMRGAGIPSWRTSGMPPSPP